MSNNATSTLRETFDSGRTRALEWRFEQLDALLRLLADHEADLLDALAADLGRPRFEGWIADIRATAREIEYLRRHIRTWARDERVRPPWQLMAARTRIVRQPLGVVLVIAPWNYPFHLLLTPMAAALAAGKAVVGKPSELTPASAGLLSRLVPEYLDPEAVTIVEGGPVETEALLRERFDHIFYTGNGIVGRRVMQLAAEQLVPVTLELGGKNPVIVDVDANIDVAAKRIAWAKFVNAGQTCLAPDFVLVHRDVEAKLTDAFAAVVRRRFGKDPSRSPDFGRIVNTRHYERVMALIEGGGYERVVCGGNGDRDACFIEPTVLSGLKPDAPAMQEEIFGPVLPVLAVDDVDEAIRFVNDRPTPLALYVFSRSPSTAERVVGSTASGGVCVNDALTHVLVPTLPFGGVGPSGTGAYHGRFGYELFSHRRAVLTRPTWFEMPTMYAPYTAWKERVNRKLF